MLYSTYQYHGKMSIYCLEYVFQQLHNKKRKWFIRDLQEVKLKYMC